MKHKLHEIRLSLPDKCRLVGVKTDGEEVVIVFTPSESEVRQIGFVNLDEVTDDDEEDEQWGKLPRHKK